MERVLIEVITGLALLALAVVVVGAAVVYYGFVWQWWKFSFSLLIGWVRWMKGKLRRTLHPPPKPITHRQFVDLFKLLDDKLYSGLLHQNGISVFLTEIRPDYPFIYRFHTTPDGKLAGETCSEPHGYSPACREIVVARNQSNEAIMKGLVIEMQRAADYQRDLYKAVASELARGAEVLEELDNLLKRSDHDDPERQMEEVVKLLGRWPKAPTA